MKEGMLTVSFGKTRHQPLPQRARRAVRFIKKEVEKHLRKKGNEIAIAQEVNELIWSKGIYNIPNKIDLNVVEVDGIARVYLKEGKQLAAEKEAEAKAKTARKKEAVKPEAKKEEAKKTEEEKKKEKELAEKKAKEKMLEKIELKRK
ncbi:60S ribosomal protein L31 [archaeon]|nr:60S ribosomal protein L31 [archaeon]